MGETDILTHLRKKKRLDLWWHDLIGQAPKVEGFDYDKAAEALPRTEATASAAIALKFKNLLSYTERDNKWYLWNERIHEPCEGEIVALQVAKIFYEALCDALEFIQDACYSNAEQMAISGVPDADKKAQYIRDVYDKLIFPKHRGFRDRMAESAGIAAMIKMLRTDCVVPGDYFDNDQRWFVMRNKVLDLDALRDTSSGKLNWIFLDHSPERPVTKYFDADWEPVNGTNDWVNFLKRSIPDEDTRNYLQRVMGAAFMGESKLKCLINLQGPPDSGKSLFGGTLLKLGKSGAGYAAMPDSKVVIKVNGQNFEQDSCRGRRFIVISEPPSSEKIDDDFVKQFTGDEWIETRTLNVKSSGWVPQGVICVLSNDRLRINFRDKAIVDRVQTISFPIHFERQIEGINHVPEERRMIDGLGDMLMDDRAAILQWIVYGMGYFVKEGQKLSPPKSVKQNAGDAITDASTALRWLTEYVAEELLEIDFSEEPQYFLPVMEAYSRYKMWAVFAGENKPLSKRFFEMDIENRYGPKVREAGEFRFNGMKPTIKYRQKYGTGVNNSVDAGF
jgi:phage/plasmid-associated DNA primase